MFERVNVVSYFRNFVTLRRTPGCCQRNFFN